MVKPIQKMDGGVLWQAWANDLDLTETATLKAGLTADEVCRLRYWLRLRRRNEIAGRDQGSGHRLFEMVVKGS
jgi:hypothetical protein